MHLLIFVASYFLPDANKTGVAHEAINNIRRASKTMTEQEARQILGVSENSTWEEIVQVCYFPFVSFLIQLAITRMHISDSNVNNYVSCSVTITCLKETLNLGAFTSNRRFTGPRSA